MCSLEGVKFFEYETYNDYEAAKDLLPRMEQGKEYILSIAKHRAIVRLDETGKGYEYLELQKEESENVWHKLNHESLKSRFGCKKSRSTYGWRMNLTTRLVEADSLRGNDAFKDFLGYLNTSEGSEKKGEGGSAK